MASDANIPHPGHVAHFVRILLTSRRQLAVFLVTEVALSIIGAPLLVHLAVGGVVHFFPIRVRDRE
jgi:hypothetical protein